MKLYGLIGYPLGHSFSKKYFNNKFEKEGLEDCFFELFPIAQINEFPALLAANSLSGLAVTIPYKQVVMPYLQTVSEAAKIIGAVNCIKFSAEGLTGFNTDCIGFEASFKTLLQPWHKKALILGTGGSSKAVAWVLNKLHIPFSYVSRTQQPGHFAYGDVDELILKEHQIIINCTPLGMTPNVDTKPALQYQYLTPQHYCYDLVYTPPETAFLAAAKQQGATVKNGYDMLVLQAVENWKIWTG